MRKTVFCLSAATFVVTLYAAAVQGVPRDSNIGNTGGYDGTRVEAQLLVQVAPDTEVVHFIRDNNDPRVVTKTYLLKHVDAYEFRDYLRQMVQAKRVGNTSMVQGYPSNTATTPVTAVAGAPQLNPASAQPGYNPVPQLGSNTAVECLKYVDGTGLLIVSAEEYRFRDSEHGMGIDSIVAMLDDPALGQLGTGSQMFIYMPKFVPAVNLQPLIENVGMNVSDVTELWQGQDLVTADSELNWLIFDVSNYSCDNIAKLLARYDVPIPQVVLEIKVYEIYSENDDRIGVDFQSWKNNEGTDFFSVGGRYRNNWAAIYGGAGNLNRTYGSERSSFYNFNPKWNSRYLDFLTSRGKAEILHSGMLVLRNNTGGTFSRTTQIFFPDSSDSSGISLPEMGVGPYQLLSTLIGEVVKAVNQNRPDAKDIPVGKGNTEVLTASAGYGFSMQVNNVIVGLKECRFDVTLQNTSLIGFLSNGAPRISKGNVVKQSVSLPFTEKNGVFVIGGLNKKEVVDSSTGVPFLSDIPYLGYLFSTKSKSVKNSELVVVAECRWGSPDDNPRGNMSKRYRKP